MLVGGGKSQQTFESRSRRSAGRNASVFLRFSGPGAALPAKSFAHAVAVSAAVEPRRGRRRRDIDGVCFCAAEVGRTTEMKVQTGAAVFKLGGTRGRIQVRMFGGLVLEKKGRSCCAASEASTVRGTPFGRAGHRRQRLSVAADVCPTDASEERHLGENRRQGPKERRQKLSKRRVSFGIRSNERTGGMPEERRKDRPSAVWRSVCTAALATKKTPLEAAAPFLWKPALSRRLCPAQETFFEKKATEAQRRRCRRAATARRWNTGQLHGDGAREVDRTPRQRRQKGAGRLRKMC